MKPSKYSQQRKLEFCQNSTHRNRLTSLLITLMASMAMLMLSAASARALTNYLANPGLETGTFTGWLDSYNSSHSIDSTNGYVHNSTTIHEPAHSGAWALKVWGTWWGSFVQTHTLSQYIPASPNSTWSADIWVYTATPDNIQNQNFTSLVVGFCGATSNEFSTVGYSAVFDTNSPVNTWVHLVATNIVDGTTNLLAPDGTVYIHYYMPFTQDAAQSGGSLYWDDANLIKTASTDPEISASPQDLTVIYGQTATFTVLASGRTTLSYAWQKDGNPVTNGGRISGATTATLTIANATTADQGSYTVTVTDNAGSLPSPSGGNLTVLDPGILTNPVSLQKLEGQSATFTVAATGSGTLSYAWYNGAGQLNNGPRISGADKATLTISNLTVADSDSYYVIVSGAGQATSTSASLYVNSLAQASQLMRNSGFESGMTYWTTWNGVAQETVTTGGEPIYDGSACCGIWGTGGGTWNGINQSFKPTPGYIYRANAWFLVSAGGLLTDAATAWLEVNFYNQGNLMNSVQSPIVSSNSVVGVWTNLSVYAVAPTGADEVRCQINYHAGGGGGGLVYVDDVNFWLRIPVTITPSVTGTNLMLSFPTQVGVTNQILFKNDLSDTAWQLLQTVVGDLSGQAAVPAPMSAPRRFYRVSTE